MKKAFISAIFLGLLFTACFRKGNKPINKIRPESNPTYEVEYLFEYEGCKIYRFHDLGNHIYFTNCNGEITSTNDSLPPLRNIINKKSN